MRKALALRAGFAVLATALLILGSFVPSGRASAGSTGFVYTETNSASGNAVLVFQQNDHGALTLAKTISTDGLGTGASLNGSAGAVAISGDGKSLFAVNAGSNDISVVNVSAGTVSDRVSSGGNMPVSVTVFNNRVYVLNAGSDNITGFILSSGKLTPIPNSTKPLSGKGVGATQVMFSPDGTTLVVTEKNTNLIDTYTLNSNGTANGPFTHPSSGATPFGFAFSGRSTLVVSEAANSAASSYRETDSGELHVISGSVLNGQAAACWVAATGNGEFAYTADAHNGEISSYHVSSGGRLTLLNGTAGSPGGGPLDEAVAGGNAFLYVLNPSTGQINGFTIQSNGSLTQLASTSGIPASDSGLVAH